MLFKMLFLVNSRTELTWIGQSCVFFHMKLITSPTFEIIPELKIAFNGYVNQLQTATKYSLT